MIFDGPMFTFLQAQEFFISPEASCARPMQNVKLLPVPVDTAAKQAQLEQRFIVKQVKESLTAMAKIDASKAKDLGQKILSEVGSQDFVPIVELHMFPDARDVNSTWRVLLIPRAKELFGETVFLCKKPEGAESTPCVAKLPFDPLPFRLMHIMRKWSPTVDPMRSTPHRLVLIMECLLLLALGLVVAQLLDSLLKLFTTAWLRSSPQDGKEKLQQDELPKEYILAQHAFVYKTAGGELLQAEPLDACGQVKVAERVEAGPEWQGFVGGLHHLLFRGTKDVLWGRLEPQEPNKPEGWIVLADETSNRIIGVGEVPVQPFCAHPELLVPLPSLLRRQLVLAAAHASVQWLLLDRLAQIFEIAEILVISVCLFGTHAVALRQMQLTDARALEFEQVLESDTTLLRLKSSKELIALLGLALLVLSAAATAGFMNHYRRDAVFDPLSAALPFLSLLTTLVLHVADFRASLTALEKWRLPQLATEFTNVAKVFQTISGIQDRGLSQRRSLRKQFVRFLTCMYALGAVSLLMFIVLDGVQMRGELVTYSFSRGYTTIPPHSQALQNTVLLHSSVDSLPFTFKPGPFTSRIQVRLEHPLVDSAAEPVTVFQGSRRNEQGEGEYSLFIPAGFLYSRFIVEATSPLHWKCTRYVIHFLRITETVTVSINASVNPNHVLESHDGEPKESKKVPIFFEKRRWRFQQSNPVWYVPDLDMRGASTLRVDYLPIVLAPLTGSEAQRRDLRGMSLLAKECMCGQERPGWGNACEVEERGRRKKRKISMTG